MNEQFIKRLKSFLWRLGSVMVIAGLNELSKSVAGLGFPVWAVGMIGLACGELTKWLNKKK